ncbi:MAG: glycosyltransferase involved in cell wall biosynthesis [Yoonia sp.]|jgi:glycosyltransferase involved in cell wall biosynthesis
MSQLTPPAIFFHADAVESKGKDIVGRRSAGQSFLKGFLKHAGGDHVAAVTQTKTAAKMFEDTVRGMGETRPVKVQTLRGQNGFSDAGAVFFPGPGYLDAAWRRQRFDPTTVSLIGITHTVSTRRVIESMHTLLAEPVEPWDAIICTSRAVQSVVQQQMDFEAEYYRARFGATRVPMPQLPLIPLGIHAHDFARTDIGRAAMRTRFNAPDDAIVIMTMGRFTSVEKANPAPMFIALEQVAQATGKPVHLWMVGWASRPEEEEMHRKGAAALCPSVTAQMIDGRDVDVRRDIWSGADIFTLPVDNIQETFGLVPIEAMAAGLPVVMPDWNGFRDTVVHGETGYLIPTVMSGAGAGPIIAQRFADGTDDYLRYLSIVQQQTMIDLPAYRDAFLALIENPEKRRVMGNAGRRHVQATFDWKAVMPQYLALADELANIRKGAVPSTTRLSSVAISPVEVDPFTLYQKYPTAHPTGMSVATHKRVLDAEGLTALDAVNGRAMYGRKIVPDATLLIIGDAVAAASVAPVSQIVKDVGQSIDIVLAALLFLAKFDYVELSGLEPN